MAQVLPNQRSLAEGESNLQFGSIELGICNAHIHGNDYPQILDKTPNGAMNSQPRAMPWAENYQPTLIIPRWESCITFSPSLREGMGGGLHCR